MPIGVLSSYDGLECLRYLSIRIIFKMANIVTWQVRDILIKITHCFKFLNNKHPEPLSVGQFPKENCRMRCG